MQAHSYETHHTDIGGWFVSEKLDGMRCFWDGGITRGLPKSEVPWANAVKDGRYRKPPIATGLWTRYCNTIHPPTWWLDKLPKVPLDGELYLGPGRRQELMSIVKQLTPSFRSWDEVKYHCFDLPPITAVFSNRYIDSPNLEKNFTGILEWLEGNLGVLDVIPMQAMEFTRRFERMKNLIYDDHEGNDVVFPHHQILLPEKDSLAQQCVDKLLNNVAQYGGEGLIVRSPDAFWKPERCSSILKIKKLDDDEGTVVGYVTGRQTDKGSKLLGLMGALILDYNGKRLELSGFTDYERLLHSIKDAADWKKSSIIDAQEWARQHPGMECPDWIEAINFRLGTKVTFKYRGKSRDGIPQEARYWRPA
jgi:DNA ligase-1